MWSHGAGADVMKRIAAPMVGGVVTSFVLELLIYPVIFTVWKRRAVRPLPLAKAHVASIGSVGLRWFSERQFLHPRHVERSWRPAPAPAL
jgi:hypothetical protein